MIQTVDVGEATIGTLGIINVLEGKIETNATIRDEIIDTPKRIDDLSRDLITGESIRFRYRPFDQKRIARIFTADPSEALHELNGISWIDHAAAMGQTLRLRNIINTVRPVSQMKSLFAVTDLEIASFTWHQFEDILGLLNDPFSVFAAIKSGRITHKLVTIFSQAYESMYEAIAGSIATQGVEYFQRHPSQTALPAAGAEASIAVFLSVDGIGDKVAAALGTPKQQGQRGKPPSEVHHSVSISLAPKSSAMEDKD